MAAAPPPPPSPQSTPEAETLNAILEAIYAAVKNAQDQMQRRAEQDLRWFFPKGPDAEHSARMVEIPIPDANGKMTVQQIPLFALVGHRDLVIDELTVRMKVSLLQLMQQARPEGLLADSTAPAPAPKVAAKLASAGTDPDLVAEVEVKFRGTQPPEGIARINDALVKRIY